LPEGQTWISADTVGGGKNIIFLPAQFNSVKLAPKTLTSLAIAIRIKMNAKDFNRIKVKYMSKTITLRLKEDVYKVFLEAARAENRSISNLIETAALKSLREQQFVDDAEMAEILSDENLMARIKRGLKEAAEGKGCFVG
jgi:uncharacterized protein (DUF1778 family)